MRLAAILGSPRLKGNSSSLAKIIADFAENRGWVTDVYHLNRLDFSGCQGCSACKGKSERCILEDDLTEVLQAVVDCDVLLLATPVYWGDVSGQMKLFIDRTYSFLKPDFKNRPDKHRLPAGKKLIWVETQGAENPDMFCDIFERYNNFFKQLEYFEDTSRLRGCGMSAGMTIAERPDLIGQAEAIAVNVIESK